MWAVAELDREGRWGADDAHVVPWWSFTKSLLGWAAHQQVEAGTWSWDEAFRGHPFTLRQLVQHRAGLPDYGALPAYQAAVGAGEEPWPFDEVWARTEADRLRTPPGAAFAYSNVGYGLLRRALEEAWGAPLHVGLRTHVLDRLGLERARVANTREDFAATVFPGGQGYHPGWVYHGVVIGPAREAALALRGLPIEALAAPMMPVPGVPAPWVGGGYATGLMVGPWAAVGGGEPFEVVGHGAGGPGSAGAVFCRRDGTTVAAFTDDPGHDAAMHEAHRRLAP